MVARFGCSRGRIRLPRSGRPFGAGGTAALRTFTSILSSPKRAAAWTAAAFSQDCASPTPTSFAYWRWAALRTTQGDGRAGRLQFVRKPLDPQQIGLVVKRALEARELARRHRLLSREFKVARDSLLFDDHHGVMFRPVSQRFEKLVFVSEKLADLCDLARKAAKTELPILIQGETGTGKELLARAIHYNSSRRASPLMVQNCGGMPDDLLQSELFGHKRGAFTGAISDRLGLFRAADGGTVFLDEISEVSPAFQISLLRFLQEGEVKPLGSDKTEICNVRIIAAANRSLQGTGRGRANIGRISISGCAGSNSRCRRCAIVPTTFRCWRSSSPPNTATRSAGKSSAFPPASSRSSPPSTFPAMCANSKTKSAAWSRSPRTANI